MGGKRLEEIIIALSLSNLLFIKGWRALIYPTTYVYHIKLEPSRLDYIAIILNVLLTSALFLGGLWLTRYWCKGKTPVFVKWAFLGILVVVLNGIRLQFYESKSGLFTKIVFLALFLSISILALAKWKKRIFLYARTLILILAPFVLVTFSQAIVGIVTSPLTTDEPVPLHSKAIPYKEKTDIKARIIWIIFDGLDYKVPFEIQPPVINMPEFNHLKRESLTATEARPPDYTTLMSLPSLITGKKVKESIPVWKNELILNFDNGETAKFSETPNIFSKVKEMDGDTAVIGWYHPYCRVIGKDLSACHWESIDTFNDFNNNSLAISLTSNFLNCFISLPFGFRLFSYVNSLFTSSFAQDAYVERHFRMLDGTIDVITNPNIDLALIHLPFPHLPNRYNRFTEKFTGGSYVDNLALTDKVLGVIRQSMEKVNLWDSSVVIVSSDHQWRVNKEKHRFSQEELNISKEVEDPRIPFIIKLRNQKESADYDKTFNTVITHDLILSLIKGEISSPQEVEEWLDAHGKS